MGERGVILYPEAVVGVELMDCIAILRCALCSTVLSYVFLVALCVAAACVCVCVCVIACDRI